MPDNSQLSPCSANEEATANLRDLESLITHAHEIAERLGTISRSLREQPVDSRLYPIDISLQVNCEHLGEIFAGSFDLHVRDLIITPLGTAAVLFFIESMADQAIINSHVIEKLTVPPLTGMTVSSQGEVLPYIQNTLLTAASLSEVQEMSRVVDRLLTGDTALFVEGSGTAIIIATRKVESRAISEPDTETDISGPRDGFTEELRVNVTLIRRRMKNPNLVIKKFTIGERSHTDAAIVYFRGITDSKLANEAEQRLTSLKIDIPENLGIQGLLEDHPYSPFSTMLTTQRPDKFIQEITLGKVGILLDGTPFALLAPAVITDFFQAGDDYFEKWFPAAFLRFLRYIAAFLALTVPALYIAITAFHPALIPTPLALTIGVSREGVPFPVFLEALLMMFALEVMQEAGIRIPKNIGPAVSIVGGLVIGDAAVRAGLVSAPLVIVNSFTAIATFAIANYRLQLSIRLLRIPLLVFAASFGLYGLIVGLLLIAAHLSILESFGEPYLAPLIPKFWARFDDLQDTLIVVPPAWRRKRPAYLETEDTRRQSGDNNG